MEIPLGRRKVEIVQGDITRETTHAIVCPHNPGFEPLPMPGGIQYAIYVRGGADGFTNAFKIAEKQWKDMKKAGDPNFPVGHAILTNAGSLPAKGIIHVSSVDFGKKRAVDERVIRESVKGVLKIANEHGLKSVSIPAIGTGLYGATIEETVHGAMKAIEEHFKSPTSVEKVRLVYYSPDDHNDALKAYDAYKKAH